jgi:hypothetical protein
VAVAEHLELDMPRPFHVAFQQYAVAAEGVARLALAGFEVGGEFVAAAHDTHALAAAAMGGLDHQRKANAFGFPGEQGRILVFAGIAGNHRYLVFLHQDLGAGLGAHLAHRCGTGADEDQSGGFDRVGEIGVFGKKAITRMDGLGAALLRHVEDHVTAQVGIGRTRTADRPGFVGEANVLGGGVRLGIHRDGRDAQAAAGADHAAGDLAAIGYQYLGKQSLHGSPS